MGSYHLTDAVSALQEEQCSGEGRWSLSYHNMKVLYPIELDTQKWLKMVNSMLHVFHHNYK